MKLFVFSKLVVGIVLLVMAITILTGAYRLRKNTLSKKQFINLMLILILIYQFVGPADNFWLRVIGLVPVIILIFLNQEDE